MNRLPVALVALSGGATILCGQAVAGDSGRRSFILSLSYTGELVDNVGGGGARRGASFVGAAGVQATLLLEPLIGWRGARMFIFVLDTQGGSPTAFVGDVQGVSNLEAPAQLRVEEGWFQQNLLGNRLSWLVGRYDLNAEFYRLQAGGLFLNSSFGIGPEFSQSGRGGPSIFPMTALGTRLDFKPSPNIVWRAAVLDGPMFIGEVALLSRPDTVTVPRHRRFVVGRGRVRPYVAKLALGAWYYTARFPDLSNETEHRGSGGAYLLGDLTVRSVAVFVQLGLGDGRVNQIGGYVGGGVTLAAPIARRPQDIVGFAVAAAGNGSHFERAQALGGVPAAGETTAELTYSAQFGAWLSVQPDVQYVIHPGGTSALRNAMALGLRVALAH